MKIKTGLMVSSLLLALIVGYVWQAGYLSAGGPVERITIGTHLNGMNGLLFVAKSQGFDKQYGLDLTIKPYPTGRDGTREVRAGRLEFACCAEFVLVCEIFTGAENLRCLGTVSSGDIHSLIARRDKGINRPEDLRGKTIGTPLGTSGEFYLGRYLTFNRVPLEEVSIVDVNLPEQAETLAAGKVDAVLAWEPATYAILNKIGTAAQEWPAQEGQDFYWLLVSREDVIKNRRAGLEKLFRALSRAAEFIKAQPAAALAIIAQWTKVPLTDLQAGKYPKRYELVLDQGLLLAMEDQARWLIGNQLTNRKQVPNYLDYIDAEVLLKIYPKAVRLIIPGKEVAQP